MAVHKFSQLPTPQQFQAAFPHQSPATLTVWISQYRHIISCVLHTTMGSWAPLLVSLTRYFCLHTKVIVHDIMGRQYRHRPQMVNRRVPYLASRILDTSSHTGPKEQSLFARFGNLTRPKNATASTMLSKTSTVPSCAEWRLQLTTIQLIALGIVNQVGCSTTGDLTFQWIQKRFKYFEIYDSALSMPCGKWTRLIHWPKNERSRLVSSMCFHEAGRSFAFYFRSLQPNTLLALLQTNMQIHEEALPTFYRLNSSGNLHGHLPKFPRTLSGLRTNRRRFLSTIAIGSARYRVEKTEGCATCFAFPTQCTELKRLTLYLETDKWPPDFDSNSIRQLDGFGILSSLCGIKVFKVLREGASNYSVAPGAVAYLVTGDFSGLLRTSAEGGEAEVFPE